MVNGMQDEAAAVEMAEVMAEVRGRLNLRATFERNRETWRKLAWQDANAQARREDTRSSWAECCGRPTLVPVEECAECRLRRLEETARVIAVERAKDAARAEWIA